MRTSLVLPDSPTTARFLSHEEKVLVVERLRANNTGTETKVWKWKQARECLLDPKTCFWFAMIFLISSVISLPRMVTAQRSPPTPCSIPSGGISTCALNLLL
jgi:hypothetical protein